MKERQLLGIHGLLPARVKTMKEQLFLCKLTVDNYTTATGKYLYLNDLMQRNEKLFYKLLTENIEQLLPIVYTPTVGLVCQRFGFLFRRPEGIFLNIYDKGNVQQILKNWPEKGVKVIVVTDGERILGLGDLGAHGMGIPVGKLSLYTALSGINPKACLPITLDCGTNNETLLNDPQYVGLREKRIGGERYEAFVDEFMEACVEEYGPNILIQFEDFGSHHAFKFLEKYRHKYCVFNDDLQGTAAVVLAGLMSSSRITGKKLSESKILFLGAGGAANGIASLLVMGMIRQGVSKEEAIGKIFLIDADGLVVNTRTKGDLIGPKKYYAKDLNEMDDLNAIVNNVKPNILIGVSTKGGAFTPKVLKSMAAISKRPVIFALSNPTNNAECTPQEAYQHTEGRCVYASGSPFKEVEYQGKTYKTGQGNNCYIFPGVGLGVMLSQMLHIPEEVFLIAADTIAENIKQEHLDKGSVYPPITDIYNMSGLIAEAIMKYAFEKNLAGINRPESIPDFIEKHQYSTSYEDALRPTWEIPPLDTKYDMEKWDPPKSFC
ncbi:unnamed protein product [Brassicogethes aeneus]|uniref:Malic enzyme n=1 Tax=Brassicogethes aeneus TaxID=1431903 RepID=A0A9P0AXT2_BRAAE|nr:unnamed protein product [Brassicogethes aeneus]